ncbi:MAG TPA: hypothetical protein VFW00_14205, partial [Rhodocyclaceae bacterium]|nr:hypothetical protein [Rhodocyclaceae bacterium]
TNESPETGESMPGRAQCETSNTVFKFVQSSENVLSAVVRDSSMTLESELRLSQQIRSVVKGAGARLGKIWLNGRAIVNDSLGDEHGS